MGGRIYYDDDRVQGVEFYYKGTTDTLLIGNKSTEQVTAVFNETHSWIGFFGTQGTDRIESLGFLVQELACSEEAAAREREAAR